MGDKHDAGKGDRYRPVDQKVWEKNWNDIFGKRRSTRASKAKGKSNNKKTK